MTKSPDTKRDRGPTDDVRPRAGGRPGSPIWLLYNVLFAFGYLLMTPRFLYRMWRRGGYRRGFAQRFGRYDDEVRRKLAGISPMWVHAVSVGEVFVALNFMAALKQARPGTRFVLSTTTSTGHAMATARMSAEDVLIYFPLDFPWIVRRALEGLRPRALVLTECEMWPNMIRLCRGRGIPVTLINGRISESSYKGYRLMRGFFRRVAGMVTLFCVQTDEDRRRLIALGAPAERIHAVGSVKYDMSRTKVEPDEGVTDVLEKAGVQAGDPVIVGGSTWSGEEVLLARCFQKLRREIPRLALVLVPRHAERAADAAADVRREGLDCALRSAWARGGGRERGVATSDRRFNRRTGGVLRARGRGVRGKESDATRRAESHRTRGAREAGHRRPEHGELCDGDR